jgi:RNA polymerase sigma-70 factor, ECF subfamily
MRDVEGMQFDDICNSLGLSTSNVRVLLHRGRLRLAAMINDFQETGGC